MVGREANVIINIVDSSILFSNLRLQKERKKEKGSKMQLPYNIEEKQNHDHYFYINRLLQSSLLMNLSILSCSTHTLS